ncbi:hypothetical protein EFQH95_2270 [Enterococcus faecalis]|nr:hypothetical protein EFQH95_2270 [Enterococcus faecalis]
MKSLAKSKTQKVTTESTIKVNNQKKFGYFLTHDLILKKHYWEFLKQSRYL